MYFVIVSYVFMKVTFLFNAVYSKEWKPGFRECALLRRQAYIPQSSRSVHVLSNESVFKGRFKTDVNFTFVYKRICCN